MWAKGHLASDNLQIKIFKLDSWSQEAGFFPFATINLLSFKRIKDSDLKNDFVRGGAIAVKSEIMDNRG